MRFHIMSLLTTQRRLAVREMDFNGSWLAGRKELVLRRLAVTSEFPALTLPLEDGGFGATPDFFSSNGDWIRQSDMPSFDGAPPAVRFGNFKMSVTAVPKLTAGDANLDNEVNFADFLILSENFGQAGAWREGDFDGDGTVDFPDFLALSANFSGAAEAASVPEPTGLSIALFGLLGMIGFRKRR